MVIRTNTLECVYYNKCQNLNFLQMHFGDTFASQFWSITYLDFLGSIISAQYVLCGQTFEVFIEYCARTHQTLKQNSAIFQAEKGTFSRFLFSLSSTSQKCFCFKQAMSSIFWQVSARCLAFYTQSGLAISPKHTDVQTNSSPVAAHCRSLTVCSLLHILGVKTLPSSACHRAGLR